MYCLCWLCCSMYCLCVNMYCTTATGCQPNCSQMCHIIYWVSVALVNQHATRHILSSVVSLVLSHFSSLSHKRHDLRKTLLNLKCVLRFSLQVLSEARYRLKCTVHRILCKATLFLSNCNKTWSYLTDFRKRVRLFNLTFMGPCILIIF